MNILVAQSGGPTAAINASLAGVIKAGLESDKIDQIYGGMNGIQGIIEDHIMLLNPIFEDEKNLAKLKITPAMYLGSCRYKLKTPDQDPSDFDAILAAFKKYEIGAFFYIGGNDSMDTVEKLADYTKEQNIDVKIVGVPKTVDNDLMQIDHTPGFGSAARYVATTVREIAMDTYIYNMDTVVIVEIMGRDAGWLTASSALARFDGSVAPHLIYLPEVEFDMESFLQAVKRKLFKYHHVIVAVSEGVKTADGEYLSSDHDKVDKFGHTALAGTGTMLQDLIKDRIGCKVRSVELNVCQRAAGHCTSETDLSESMQLGENGVKYALDGMSGVMASIFRTSDAPYSVEYGPADIHGIANAAKPVPREWISEDGTDVTDGMIQYLKPLVLGNPDVPYTDGLPDYIIRNK